MVSALLVVIVATVTMIAFAIMGILYSRGHGKDLDDYISARKSLGTSRASATFMASVIGVWILFSPAESATWGGLAAIMGYGLGQAAPLLAFYFFAPRIKQLMSQGHGITEYAWFRFGKATYILVLIITGFYMFIFLVAELTAVSLAFNLVAGIPLIFTALLVCLAVVSYTAYGGLRASLLTDTIQAGLIVSLIAISFGWVITTYGGLRQIILEISNSTPELVNPFYQPGIEFSIFVVIAILGANLFHQGYWQRIYACVDDKAMRRGFLISGLSSIPIVVIAGLLGLIGFSLGLIPEGSESVALFSLIVTTFPEWLVIVMIVLSLALVASSMDTLFNGIISLIVIDLARFKPHLKSKVLLRVAKWGTLGIAAPAILLASQGYSVLFLFLLADLVAVAAVFPIYFGLYSRRLSGNGAFISTILGLVFGLPFFVLAMTSGGVVTILGLTLGFTSLLLIGFVGALLIPMASTLIVRVGTYRYDFKKLNRGIELNR